MAIVKWDPFAELDDMQARFNQMFGGVPVRRTKNGDTAFADWSPAADVQETDKEYLIKADLPEVNKEHVKVEMRDGMLTIEGERKTEKEEKGRKFHVLERAFGKFTRRFVLPADVDAAKVEAEFKDGVLNVHLPKAANAARQTIDVKVS